MKLKIIILSLIGLTAFALRVIPHWSDIFIAPGVQFFLDTDSFYHLRLTDYLIGNFPHSLSWDYYAQFPDGALPYFRPMLSFLIAGISMVIGLGDPSYQLVNTVGALVPPVLGVITVLLSYWLAKITFKSTFIAYVAALLVAIFPTELLHRSMLGYADHHILEVVFGLLTLICVIKFDATKSLKWSLAGGVSLAALHYTWTGAPLWGGILFIWFLIAFFRQYLKNGWNSDLNKLSIGMAVLYAVAVTLIIPLIPTSQTKVDILLAGYPLVIFFMLAIGRNLKPKWGITAIAGTFALALIGVAIFKPSLLQPVMFQLTGVFWGFGSTISEAMPSDLGMIYYFFGIAALFAAIGLAWAIRKKENGLFIFWSLVFIVAMIGQRRWAYVATVPIVILAAYAVIKLASIFTPLIKWVAAVTAIFVIICGTIPAQIGMTKLATDITPGWYNACVWLRNNTPEPYAIPKMDIGGVEVDAVSVAEYVPQANYTVLSWWDYGHFIIRIAHRVPMANPAQQINVPAFRFLLSQTDEEAESYEFAPDVKYIVIDNFMASPGDKNGRGTKFYAMVIQAALPGNPDWRDVLPNSLVYRLYTNNETEHYILAFQSQDVKVFQRKDS